MTPTATPIAMAIPRDLRISVLLPKSCKNFAPNLSEGASKLVGEPGRSVDVIEWQVNPLAFTITPRMRDGSYAPSLNLLPLFRAYDRQVHGEPPVAGKPPAKQTSAPRVEPPPLIEFIERASDGE